MTLLMSMYLFIIFSFIMFAIKKTATSRFGG